MANQHGDNGGLELLGGSQVIAPDGTVYAHAARGAETAPCHLVSTITLRASLEAAAAECGPLLACRRPELYTTVS
jgi:predicted amidohydrolase